MHYIFVINGRSDYAHIVEDVRKQLEPLDVKHTMYVTTGIGDATRYTRVYCDLHSNEEVCFVACGGTGTINEVASGIVGETNKSIAILGYGYTNDFLKNFPGYDFQSIEKILKGEVKKIDILKVNDNYAINVCNFGFDSIVASEANYLVEIKKSKPYERGIFRAIIAGRFNRIKVVADGKALNRRRLLSCCLANGKYVGGQFLCTPKAEIDDGLIDICLLKPMTLTSFLRLIKPYRSGEHIQPQYARKVVYTKAKHVDIISKNIIKVVIDGELLPGTRFSVDLLPQAVQLRLPGTIDN